MRLKVGSTFEYLCYALVIGGGLVALGADKASMHWLREAALVAVVLGIASFGLDMIVKRRAEISTRYASDLDPDFHVFRGWAAICWGIGFALFAFVLIGFALVRMAEWAAVEEYFRAHPGILVMLGGVIVAAFGAGSAGRATHRYKETEKPASRVSDRLLGMFWLVVGVCIITVGLLRTFAPALLDALKAAALSWIVELVPK